MDADDRDGATAVTINAAAAQIGCHRPFIHDLLKRDKLSGPAYPDGAPRNAPRVYQTSIDEYLEWKAQRRRNRDNRRPNTLATETNILDRLDELTRIVQQDLRDQRSRRNTIAAQLADLVALNAKIASDRAEFARNHATALSEVHKLFGQLSGLADSDNDTVDHVLAGYRGVLTALLDRRFANRGGTG